MITLYINGLTQLRERLRQTRCAPMSVEAARVGQDPHSRPARQLRLRPDRRPRLPESGPVGSDTQYREPRDAKFGRLGGQYHAACSELPGVKFIGSRGGAGYDVRDAEAGVEQPVLLGWLKLPVSEPGPVQGRPEPVTRPGEVVARCG